MAGVQRELAQINKELLDLGQLTVTELTLLAGHYKHKLEMIEVVVNGLYAKQAEAQPTREVVGASTRKGDYP